jgi:hypothetical protein
VLILTENSRFILVVDEIIDEHACKWKEGMNDSYYKEYVLSLTELVV